MLLCIQIILMISILILCIFACLLLNRLRYMVISIQKLAESVQCDFHTITTDLHEFKIHTDRISILIINSLESQRGFLTILNNIGNIFDIPLINKRLTRLKSFITNFNIIIRIINRFF